MPEHIRNNFAKEDGDYRLSHSPCLKIILYFIDSSCFNHTCTSLRLILKIVFWVAGGWAWRGVWFHSVWLYCHIYLTWGNVGPYTAFKKRQLTKEFFWDGVANYYFVKTTTFIILKCSELPNCNFLHIFMHQLLQPNTKCYQIPCFSCLKKKILKIILGLISSKLQWIKAFIWKLLFLYLAAQYNAAISVM